MPPFATLPDDIRKMKPGGHASDDSGGEHGYTGSTSHNYFSSNDGDNCDANCGIALASIPTLILCLAVQGYKDMEHLGFLTIRLPVTILQFRPIWLHLGFNEECIDEQTKLRQS